MGPSTRDHRGIVRHLPARAASLSPANTFSVGRPSPARGIAATIVIYRLIRLHLEKTSASDSRCAFAPPANGDVGPNGGAILRGAERTDASRRFLPHRQIIAFDFSLRFLPPALLPYPACSLSPLPPPVPSSRRAANPHLLLSSRVRAIGDHSLLI